MICKILKYDKDSKQVIESSFNYPVNDNTIEKIEFKRNGLHKAMTLWTKAYQENKFDLIIVCTGSPFEISPTAVCVPIGVRIDRPMTYFNLKYSIYTAKPKLELEEKQILLDYYNEERQVLAYGESNT